MSDQGYGQGSYGKEEFAASQTHLPEKWIERMDAMLEIPPYHEVWRFWTAMAISEGGTARWNPLNTVNHIHSQAHGDWQSSPDYNSVGVCNYNHPWQGIMATVDTLEQSAWVDFLKVLRQAKTNGTKAEAIVDQFGALIQQQWGTNPQTIRDVLKRVT